MLSDRYWRDGDVPHHCGEYIEDHIYHEGRLICPNHPDFDELEASAT